MSESELAGSGGQCFTYDDELRKKGTLQAAMRCKARKQKPPICVEEWQGVHHRQPTPKPKNRKLAGILVLEMTLNPRSS